MTHTPFVPPRELLHRGLMRLTPVAPVHIGSGDRYVPIDYVIDANRFRVKDVRAFFEAHRDDPQFAVDAVENGLHLGDDYVRYTLPVFGAPAQPQRPAPPPRSRHEQPRSLGRMDPKTAKLARQADKRFGASPAIDGPRPPLRDEGQGEVLAFIKDPSGQAFVPGSSVKGMIRTVIACELGQDDAALGRPAVPYQRFPFNDDSARLFGKIIEDFMKAFVVRDSHPLDMERACCLSRVVIKNLVRNGRLEDKATPILAECLVPGVPVELPFHINAFVLEHDTALRRRTGADLLRRPEALLAALRTQARQLWDYERDFYARYGAPFPVPSPPQEPNAFLWPLGFGTGWHTKTVGRQMAPKMLESVRHTYGTNKEGRSNKRMGSFGSDLPFPKTRKWASGPAGSAPMGWVKVEITWL